MSHPKRTDLTVRLERAILAGVILPGEPVDHTDALAELRSLARTAGARVVDQITQRRRSADKTFFIGKGKTKEIKELAKAREADVIIFDHDLTPGQLKNLEEATDTKVVDRSELILDIFATHARSHSAKVQVELAQLEYTLPRLRRMWKHLGRIEGGIGTRGPGEQQLEVDRRRVRRRVADLKGRLKAIEKRKAQEVKARAGEFCVSLVGYTNAGKSTVMNALTGAGVKVEDKLFATLETRTRPWELPGGRKVLLSDTVGFIRKLPHHLVTSFRATLEEAKNADLLLHVVDASHPDAGHQIEAVNAVLKEIGCAESAALLALNKHDAVADEAIFSVLAARHPAAVVISALTGEGLGDLQRAVALQMSAGMMEVRLAVPARQGRAYAAMRQRAEVMAEGIAGDDMEIHARIPGEYLERLLREFPAIRFLPDSPDVLASDDDEDDDEY